MKLSNDIGAMDAPVNYGAPAKATLMDPGSRGFVSTGQQGPAVQVRENPFVRNVSLFPAATGLPGEPRVKEVDAFTAGPGGTVTRFGVHRSWTWGF